MSTSDGSTRNLADTNAQLAPKRNEKPAVWSLVMRDMTERDIFGAEKYGTRLQPGNGRDFLLDAYQEALDLVVYLRGAIYERDEAATVKESLTVHPAGGFTYHFDPMTPPPSFGQQNMIDPADVEISEQSDKPGFAELLSDFRNKADAGIQEVIDKAIEPYRQSVEDFLSAVPCDEPASQIDDDSPRMQAIGQNGEMASEVYAAVDGAPSWDDAPKWAKWLAQDEDGKWQWYSLKPALDDESTEFSPQRNDQWWIAPNYECTVSATARSGWRSSLQPRPIK